MLPVVVFLVNKD